MQSSVTKRVEALGKLASPASKYSLVSTTLRCNEAASFTGTKVNDHRNGNVGNHVTLYYRGFQTFVDECEENSLDADNCCFAMEMCNTMAQSFEKESDRVNTFTAILLNYFPLLQFEVAKMGQGKCDVVVFNRIYIEIKNELGSGDSDSGPECLAYYFQALLPSPQSLNLCPEPAFIIQLAGPNLIISGCIFGEHPCVDRLVPPLWLVPQPHDNEAMIKIAIVFKALKRAMFALNAYYCNLPKIQNPRFPQYQSYEFEGRKYEIKYTEQMKNHLFLGTVDNEKVVIKFTETYCEEAHTLLAELGYAPRLYWCGGVTSRFQMVVMEYVSGCHVLDYISKYPDAVQPIKTQCTSALKCLHDRSLCHGDFRHTNMLVRDSGNICILDYEWAGKVGQVRYPFYMNHQHIEWPTGASDGELITKDHDTHWVDQIFS